MVTTTPPVDTVQAVIDAFRSVASEEDARLDVVEGEVPAALRGKLLRNGPGKLEVHGTPLMHPFDGDGMVSEFTFGPDGVRYRNRWVRTREFEAEERAGRILYRNFGTNLPGGLAKNFMRTHFKNAANTSIVHHGGKLLALWEAGLPHALDPETLETRGRDDYDGALTRALPRVTRWMIAEAPFSAHPKIDPKTEELYNFGLLIGPRPGLSFHRIGADGQLRSARYLALRRASFIHDFTITARHAVFFATPIRFDVPRALSGLRTPVDAIRRDPSERTEILVVPLDGGPERRILAPDGFFIFHFFNAFERDDHVVVDGCRMDDFPGGTVDLRDPSSIRGAPFDPAYPTRWTVDASRVREERLSSTPMELPFVDRRFVGRPHRFGWATARTRDDGSPLYTGLARFDFATGEAVVRDLAPDLPGEPVFVPAAPHAAEGDGWILSVVYRAHTRISELWILDPVRLDPVARLPLPHHLPPGFHGAFVAATPS